MRTQAAIALLTIVGAFSSATSAWSATQSKTDASDYKKAQKEFTDACRDSFRKSSTQTSEEVAKTICECTAKDSKGQGAKASSLRKEAAEIRKDPKHEIKDQNIMNAFRWCTIELMRKADAEEQGHAVGD